MEVSKDEANPKHASMSRISNLNQNKINASQCHLHKLPILTTKPSLQNQTKVHKSGRATSILFLEAFFLSQVK